MPDPRGASSEERLNRFWSELAQPSGAPDADDGLDPATADAVRRLHALGAAPPPALSRERVRRAVAADVRSRFRPGLAKEIPVTRADAFDLVLPAAGSNGRTVATFPGRPSMPAATTVSPRWGVPHAAALLVVTLGLGFFTLGPGRQRADGPIGVRAIVAPATPVLAASVEETVAVLDLPAAMVPSEGSAYWGFTHSTLPPGTELIWDAAAGSGNPGVRFEHVLAGVYTVHPEPRGRAAA